MPSSTGIWSQEEALNHHVFDPNLALAIAGMFHENKQVIDIGCGLGTYCKFLHGRGFKVLGYEGTPGIREIAHYKDIVECDLTKVPSLPAVPQTICLEVGEHIPKDYQNQFLDLIAQSTTERAIISWAAPSQGGHGHVNERINSITSCRMLMHNFYMNPEWTMALREKVSRPWFKHSLMVFDKWNRK